MALSTNRTLITQTGINTHQVLNVGGLDSAGIATFSNFKTGFSNVHSIGFDVGSAATIRSTGNASFTGVVTALKFVGDISEATGAAAGLGTALSQTQTDPLNKIYYTDKVLSISTTQTIDHPATANLAYTQYSDIKIEDGHDLIIKDGDDFKYDILGISTTKLLDTNNFPDGLRGDLIGDVTGDVTGNINNSSNLLLKTDGVERIRITSTGNVGVGEADPSPFGGEYKGVDVAYKGSGISGRTGNPTFTMRSNIYYDGSNWKYGEGNTTAGVLSVGGAQLIFETASSGTAGATATISEKFRINTDGNVTKPNNFHILVRRSGNQTGYSATFPGDNILWNDVVTAQSSTNASNHFNTSTGIFTVPVTGLYFFHAAVNCNFNVQGAWLVVNGSRANYSAFNPNSANTSDGTITYKLTAGQTVALKWYENGGSNRTINANDLHTWWRIVLLG